MGVQYLQLHYCSDLLCRYFELGYCSDYLWMCHFVCVAVKEEFDSQKAVCHLEQFASYWLAVAGAGAGAGQGEGVVLVEQSGPTSGPRMQHRRHLQQPWPRPRGSVSGGLAAAGEAVTVYHPRGVAW